MNFVGFDSVSPTASKSTYKLNKSTFTGSEASQQQCTTPTKQPFASKIKVVKPSESSTSMNSKIKSRNGDESISELSPSNSDDRDPLEQEMNLTEVEQRV